MNSQNIRAKALDAAVAIEVHCPGTSHSDVLIWAQLYDKWITLGIAPSGISQCSRDEQARKAVDAWSECHRKRNEDPETGVLLTPQGE